MSPRVKPKIPIEAEVVTPDAFTGRSLDEIANLSVWEGNTRRRLGDFFEVEGKVAERPGDLRIIIDGDASRVKYIGAKMTAGEIYVRGSVGMHAGDEMRGGKIIVEGNVDSFTALSMRGGELIVKGHAKDYLGSAPRGEWRGMQNGRIIVEGNAGREVGSWMMEGLVRIKGNVSSFAGVHMSGGTIIVEGNAGMRIGAEMTGGTIIVLGRLEEILPGFQYNGIIESMKVDEEVLRGPFLWFTGDLVEDGEGNLYLLSEKNKHLLA